MVNTFQVLPAQLRWRAFPACIEKHVSDEGGANQIAFCIGKIDASDTQRGTNPKQAGASEDATLAGGPEIIDLHFNRGDPALTAEVTVNCHSDCHIGHGSRHSAMSDSGAVGQFMAQPAFDGHAIAMNAGELYPEQRIERNLRQELTNLAGGEFGVFHRECEAFAMLKNG
jgi:hypothetical protein